MKHFPIQMMLGLFKFEIGKNSYNELKEIHTYRWDEIETIGGSIVQGGTAKKSTVSIHGIVNTVKGGKWAVWPLKIQADLGIPLVMVDFYGIYHGKWVVEKIENSYKEIVLEGLPRIIEFSMDLKKYE